MRLVALLPATLFVLLPLGCAHQPRAVDPGINIEAGAPEAQATAAPSPSNPAPAAAIAPATPLAPAAAAAATPMLAGIGQSEAPGAQPEGGPFAGQFLEGQSLGQPINLQPGKCYTIVAVGMGVGQVEVQLVMQPAPMFPPTVIAQSSPGSGSVATLGGRATGCFKNPLPIAGPATIVVKAVRGGGMAAAQVYVK